MKEVQKKLTGVRIEHDINHVEQCVPQGPLQPVAQALANATARLPQPPPDKCKQCGLTPNITLIDQPNRIKVIERTQNGREHHTIVAKHPKPNNTREPRHNQRLAESAQ